MSEVKRYCPLSEPVLTEGNHKAWAIETDNGPYVLFEDYAALQARYARLLRLLRDIEAAERPPDSEWCTPPWSELCDRIHDVLNSGASIPGSRDAS